MLQDFAMLVPSQTVGITLAYLDKEGSNNAPGIDESWDPQVLDALLGEDGGTSLKPRHVVCAVEELRDDATCINRHNSSASASCVVPKDAIRHGIGQPRIQ